MIHNGPLPRATLAEVARSADVSLKTASRALNGEPYVTEQTRQRVLDAAARLGYERNAAAALLASGQRSDTLGLITGDLSNPFYSILAVGIEESLRGNGMRLSVASSGESPDREWALVSEFAAARVRAIIVASSLRDHAAYADVLARGIPVVFVDRQPVGVDADAVVFDDVAGGRIAARHLLDIGHRRIAFLGDYDWLPTSRRRLAGIAAELQAASPVHDGATAAAFASTVRMGLHSPAEAEVCVAELLEQPDPATAVIAGNNRITLGAAAHMRRMAPELRPALLGFDDFEWADVIGVSVIAGDAAKMGEIAASRALARMGDREARADRTVLGMRLIARGSGERVPAALIR